MHVRSGSALVSFSQQATLSPAFRNSPLGWLRTAAGSYIGRDLPAFRMGMTEVNSCATSTGRRDFVPLRNSLLQLFTQESTYRRCYQHLGVGKCRQTCPERYSLVLCLCSTVSCTLLYLVVSGCIELLLPTCQPCTW